MTQEIDTTVPSTESQSGRLFIHMLMQFLLAVRYHKKVVLVALLLTSSLGAAYYVTATRYYAATAGMLMIHAGIDNFETSMTTSADSQRGLMKTYETVLQSPKLITSLLY